MRTREALAALVGRMPDTAVYVSSLGRTSEEMYALRPDDTLFVDSMGDVTAITLGIALGAPGVPVLGVDTDGSFLMNLSVLPVLGALVPAVPNFGLVIMDDGIYASGGGRASRVCDLRWPALFGAVGIDVTVVDDAGTVPDRPAGGVVVCRVQHDEPPGEAVKTVDGVESSYLVEKRLALRKGLRPRRPAIKA